MAGTDRPKPGTEAWWRLVLTDPKEHCGPLRRTATISVRSGTVESLERVGA